MKWYSVGSLSFPASWVAIAFAFIGAYLYLRLTQEKQAADLYSNAFFILILTWKLSVILFQFETIIKNPFSIVYFNGGMKGYWLGIAAAFLYFFLSEKKSQVQENTLHVKVWIVIITVYELVFYLLNKEHILFAGLQLIGGIAFFMLLNKNSGNPIWGIQILVFFTCFQGLIYSLEGNLLSVPIATYTSGTLLIAWTAWKGSRKNQ
ncbi:hypothetical protein D5F11_004255 [Siminovitchia terrae]|uniref:Uncharacterized protein n=1 Tax=Siminovitchia terrae TaxID=1914933 RepID=A0A429XD26_SIMTE|nr:hypothetical protein [Siminovitchia terrae]RST61259.1 hypothetical protein D5F11_004255 [Siminovitchia terrae]